MKIKYFVLAIIAALFLSSYINKEENLKPGEKAPYILRADGTKENLEEGKYTLVNFWSVKKPQSRVLNKKYAEYFAIHHPDSIEFLSISLDEDISLANEVRNYDEADCAGKYMDASQLASRVYKDFKVNETPNSFLIGPDGRIVDKKMIKI